jgi:serine/threonine protein kinase
MDQILKPIGEGGMASVFLAVQLSLDREVALKVMSPRQFADYFRHVEYAHITAGFDAWYSGRGRD